MFSIWHEFRFSAAHSLKLGAGHKCSRVHGHTYAVRVEFGGHLRDGMVRDYSEIRAEVAPLVAQLDHSMLNDTIENPTAERIAEWFGTRIVGVSAVVVQESPDTGARWTPPLEVARDMSQVPEVDEAKAS